MQAIQLKVTVKTVEVKDGDDYTMKMKIKKKYSENRKPLMDSTIEINAINHANWLSQAKETARRNLREGIEYSQSDTYWVEDKEKEAEVQKKSGEKVKEPKEPTGDGKKTIAQVREIYETVIGKKPFNGWGIEELEAKIKEAE